MGCLLTTTKTTVRCGKLKYKHLKVVLKDGTWVNALGLVKLGSGTKSTWLGLEKDSGLT